MFNTPVTLQQAEQQKDINYMYTILGGNFDNGVHVTTTWNFVNETSNGTVIAKGKMIFGGTTVAFRKIIDNKIIWALFARLY